MAQSKETHQGQIEGVVRTHSGEGFVYKLTLPPPPPTGFSLPLIQSGLATVGLSACLCEGQDHSTLGCQNKEREDHSKQGENHKKQGEDHSKQDGYEDHSKQGEDHSKQREGKEDRESG